MTSLNLVGCSIGRAHLPASTLTIDKSTIEKHFGTEFYIARTCYDYDSTNDAARSQMLPIIRTYNPDRIELARRPPFFNRCCHDDK
jgi:hypothetical protein